MRAILIAAAVLVAFGTACAHHEAAKVDDSGLARLNEQQMAPVDDARVEAGRAQDAVARARAAESDARAQREVAKGDHDVADAQLKRAMAEREMLKKQYAGKDVLARTDQDVSGAQDRLKADDIKIRYLDQLITLRETERAVAEAHVATTQAQTEQAKLRAMQAGHAPQAASVNAGDIDQQVAHARSQEAELQKRAAEQRTAAVDLYNQWERLDASARTMSRPNAIPTPPPISEPR